MTDYNRVNSSNLDAIRLDGTAFPANRDGAPSTWGVTMAANTTYYFPIGAPKAPVPAEVPLESIHFVGFTVGMIATITYEDSNLPSTASPGDGRGPADATDNDQTVGYWIPENPASATVAVVGTGWTSSAMTVSAAGTGVGGAMFHIGNTGSRRGRLKVVTGATGGRGRAAVHGKAGG